MLETVSPQCRRCKTPAQADVTYSAEGRPEVVAIELGCRCELTGSEMTQMRSVAAAMLRRRDPAREDLTLWHPDETQP